MMDKADMQEDTGWESLPGHLTMWMRRRGPFTVEVYCGSDRIRFGMMMQGTGGGLVRGSSYSRGIAEAAIEAVFECRDGSDPIGIRCVDDLRRGDDLVGEVMGITVEIMRQVGSESWQLRLDGFPSKDMAQIAAEAALDSDAARSSLGLDD